MGTRMYYILKILFEAEGIISAKEILNRLSEYSIHLNIKTVSSTIEVLNDLFYEIVDGQLICSKHRVGYYINQTLFSLEEIQFLLDCILMQEDLNHADQILLKDKLLSISTQIQRKEILSYGEDMTHKNYSLLRNMNTINKAINTGKKIQFNYITYEVMNNKLVEVNSTHGNTYDLYIISPYRIVSSNNHYYIIGYNTKFKSLVNYRLDRMRNIIVKRSNIDEIREQYNMEEEVKKTINMYTTNDTIQDLVLQINNQQTLREIVSRFKEVHHAVKTVDSKYIITLKDVRITEGLKGWIMMLGENIQVLQPYDLKLDIKQRLEKILNEYKKEMGL